MIPAAMSIFVATSAIDMRRAFDGLAEAARSVLGKDPKSGALFVFYNARRDRLKLVWWDRSGYCLLYKRLDRGVFRIPEPAREGETSVMIEARELAMILEGIELPPKRRPTAREIAREGREKVLRMRSDGSALSPP